MFLDQKLYETALLMHSDGKSHVDIVNELYRISDYNWQKVASDFEKRGVINAHVAKEILNAIDRTFNSYTLFLSKLHKQKHPLASVVSEYSYRNAFMANEKLAELYNKWKTATRHKAQ